MDDVLVSAVCGDCVSVAMRRVGRTLHRAGLLVSAKSVIESVRMINFIGKKFDCTAGLMGSDVAL